MSQMKKRHYGGDMSVVPSSDDDIEYHGNAEDGGYGVEGHHYGWYDAEQFTKKGSARGIFVTKQFFEG